MQNVCYILANKQDFHINTNFIICVLKFMEKSYSNEFIFLYPNFKKVDAIQYVNDHLRNTLTKTRKKYILSNVIKDFRMFAV